MNTHFLSVWTTKTHTNKSYPLMSSKKRIANTLGDCTIKEGATGYYTHDNGVKVIEKSLEVTKFGGTKRSIINLAKQLKQTLNQESIILKTQVSKSDFI